MPITVPADPPSAAAPLLPYAERVCSWVRRSAVAAGLMALGMLGFLARRNLIVMFLCTELMFQGVAMNLVAFGRYLNNDLGGQAFTIFILVIAAAEASLALGLVVLLFRQKNTLDADAWRELKG